MSEEAVEQITKVPTELESQAPKKEKNPKKVAAGKKLADCNKKLKAAYEREKKTEAENVGKSSGGWSLQAIAVSVVVLGVTAYNLYLRYRKKDDKYSVVYKEPPPNTRELTTIKTSKIGMQ